MKPNNKAKNNEAPEGTHDLTHDDLPALAQRERLRLHNLPAKDFFSRANVSAGRPRVSVTRFAIFKSPAFE